jgi:ABC-type nitrate/sulfonate/bicarbonate transport system ATPase subunit
MQTTSEAPIAEPHSNHRRATDAPVPSAAIQLGGLAHSFGPLAVIEGLDLQVERHEVLGVVGPSGCGKSTLLELVAGLREPTGGAIAVDGAGPPAERLAHCAYMPQRDLLLPWLSAADNASLALRNRGHSRREAHAMAAPLLARFGLAGFENSRPHQLSGGMRQRVAFARTLLSGKPVLLLDEPFGGLDAITRGEMQEWLAQALAAERRTTLLVTHDMEEALYLADRVVVLSARPTHAIADVAAPAPRARPRLETVTDPGFIAAREHAMAALLEGHR